MSMTNSVREGFKQMGARVAIVSDERAMTQVNIGRDGGGDRFILRSGTGTHMRVLDARPGDRHLVLETRDTPTSQPRTFLCGFDERSWFVAAIPETAQAETVQEAKDALKPREVWESIHENLLPFAQRDTRRNAAFLRQGEWFCLPRPWFEPDGADVVRDEPIRRGRGKPHICEFLTRTGGEEVWVSSAHPNGITADERRLMSRRERKLHKWQTMYRDVLVYVKGQIRHADHATITFGYWHQVAMNTESKASAMQNVAFLD